MALQGIGDIEVRANNAGRPLRERRTVKPCPNCKADIAEFLSNPQVNRWPLSCLRSTSSLQIHADRVCRCCVIFSESSKWIILSSTIKVDSRNENAVADLVSWEVG